MEIKKAFFDVLYVLAIITVIYACFFLVKFMKSEAKTCIQNPYLYGASKMGGISCNCVQRKGINDQCPAQFSFNDTYFNDAPTRCGLIKTIDWNALNLTVVKTK